MIDSMLAALIGLLMFGLRALITYLLAWLAVSIADNGGRFVR